MIRSLIFPTGYCPIDGGIQSTYNFNVLIQEEANA
jgi:hypothetical protein